MSHIGERIKKERTEQGLSLDKLSSISGVSKTYLSELENNQKSNPSADVLLKIAMALKVSLPYLIEGTENEANKEIPIPRTLKEFAMEADLKYSEVLQLAKTQSIALAHRGKKLEGEQVSKEGWKKIYETFKEQGLL